jgi:pyridoxamine 5'-phosphate oxidase
MPLPIDTPPDADLDLDPLASFGRWYRRAADTGVAAPDAAALATATPDGRPSVRMVLLKTHDLRGFVFVTSYASRKARELDANPYAALAFHWEPLARQVRVEGRVARTSTEESRALFHARPRGSQIAAMASPQSAVIPDRAFLEQRVAALAHRHGADADGGADLPLPDDWGGYRVVPTRYEFWIGRPNRLHDRFAYEPDGAGGWTIARLAP